MGMKNDVSFLLDETLSFYEQQSTYNPNMPIRYLIYIGMSYSGYIENNDVSLFTSKTQKLPTPKCICFYNGPEDEPDNITLKLSDSFEHMDADVEVTVHMININNGRNKNLLDACKPLREYAIFIDKTRAYQLQGKSFEDAVGMSIDALPADSVLKSFLLSNKAEVTNMCITEYNAERQMELLRREEQRYGREEGRVEGRAEGRTEGRLSLLFEDVRDGIRTPEQAAIKAGMSLEDFNKAYMDYKV